MPIDSSNSKGRSRLAFLARSAVLCVFAVIVLSAGPSLAGNDVQPAPQTPSNVAWTAETITRAVSGNALRGLILARRCDRCHGREGFSSSPAVPNLAGMDRLVIWKQLDDFRSGKRTSFVMQPIAGGLSPEDSADLAAYYWIMPTTPDPQDDRTFPQPLTEQKNEAIAIRLITAGDGTRGIPPCQACHGPVGAVTGAPSLATQNSNYLLGEIEAFAAGKRSNDINLRMRSIARQLTEEERRALAQAYGAGLGEAVPATQGK